MNRADEPAVEVRELSVRYGAVQALDSATLVLGRGRICGLIGMNGSGKSTLLKAIMGLVRPVAGSVMVEGAPPERARRRGALGYVPQAEEVDWDFPVTVQDVAMMGRYNRLGPSRRPRAEDRAAVAEALERVGLADLRDRPIGALSGGQRKRAFLARAIAQRAGVLLLDEPFAGVDRSSERTLTTILRELAGEGTAVLVSTHDLRELPRLADEAVLLNRSVLMHGAPEEVLRPANLARAFGLDPLDDR